MTDIKIFVSNRIDKDAEHLPNKYFIPVRCGAFYDENKHSKILGDDTGENISKKRMSFCELTVLYWAWKNQSADYMGLCHYRRFLSFSDKEYSLASEERNNGCYSAEYINSDMIEKYGLSEKCMEKEIKKYDAIVFKPIDLGSFNIKSNYEAMQHSPDYHFMKDVDLMMDVIKKKSPEMYDIANKYMFEYDKSYLYNCFIMKREIFNQYCSWLFDILFEIEKKLDMSTYTCKQYRTPGTLAERLTGIFIMWLKSKKVYKLKETPIVFIEDTSVKLIEKLKNKNNVVVVSNFNDKYAAVFSVFLKSVLEHKNEENYYDIIIASNDLSNSSKKLLNNMVKNEKNVSLRYIRPEYSLLNVKKSIRHDVYSMDLYYRIVIPQLLPAYDKILVVDADMVCLEDIANLYNIDISNYLAAGVKDVVYGGYLNGMVPDCLNYTKQFLKLTDPYSYINTGVILFNAKKYREKYSLDFLRQFISNYVDKVKIYEQDMLNILLKDNLLFLPEKWNTYTKSNEFIEKCLDLTPYIMFERWKDARKSNLGIIHYAAHPKPWWNTSSDMSDIWWYYAKKTIYYEYFLQECANYVFSTREKESQDRNNLSILFKDALCYKKLLRKYIKRKFLSKILFGRISKKYEEKAKKLKIRINKVKNSF